MNIVVDPDMKFASCSAKKSVRSPLSDPITAWIQRELVVRSLGFLSRYLTCIGEALLEFYPACTREKIRMRSSDGSLSTGIGCSPNTHIRILEHSMHCRHIRRMSGE